MRSRRDQIEFFRQAIDAEVTAQAKSIETAGIAREQEGLKLQNLQEIQLTEEQIAINREAQANSEIAFQNLVLKMQNLQKKNKEDQIKQDLKQAALSQGSARDSMKAVIRAETLEGIAGLISSILKGVPFPLNAILAAGAGAKAASIYDANLSKFALGGDFITDGPQMIMVGDNAGGRERVQVTPLSSPNVNGPQEGISVNFNAPVTNDEYVRDFIIPEIKKATRMNLA